MRNPGFSSFLLKSEISNFFLFFALWVCHCEACEAGRGNLDRPRG